MATQKTRYTLVHVDGQIETVTIPSFMGDCHDVAARLPHTMVFMHLVKGRAVYAETATNPEMLVTGPAIIYADSDGRRVRTELPTSEHHAYQIYRTYIHREQQSA